MNREESNLLREFSAYMKVSIKHTRQEYLEKKTKIRSHEMPYEEEEMQEETEEKDILWQVAAMSESLEKGVMDVWLLLDQIEDSVLFQAVSALARQQKEVLLLRVFYLKSFGEIGNLLGMTPKKAENTYYNAIKKVRKLIGGDQDGI